MAKSEMPTGIRSSIMWAIGLSIIALILVVNLILFGNLSGNLGFDDDTATITVTNETGAYVNATGYTLDKANSSTSSHAITAVWANVSGTPYLMTAANYTVSSAGVLTNATEILDATGFVDANVSYTLTYSFDGEAETNAENVIGNYSASAVNISSQFPTVGTIIGIALLLVVLIGILVFAVSRLMQAANVSGGSSSKGNFNRAGFG